MNPTQKSDSDPYEPEGHVSLCCGTAKPRMDYTPTVDGVQMYIWCPRCKTRGPEKNTPTEAATAWNEQLCKTETTHGKR